MIRSISHRDSGKVSCTRQLEMLMKGTVIEVMAISPDLIGTTAITMAETTFQFFHHLVINESFLSVTLYYDTFVILIAMGLIFEDFIRLLIKENINGNGA